MKFIKRFFSKEKEEEIEEVPEEVEETPEEKQEENKDGFPICPECGMRILPEQKRTFGGQKLHIQCLRKLRKYAKRQARGM